MYSTDNTEAFYDFLGEYADFFGEMELFEQQKLTAMLAGKLPEIEQMITAAQANAKKLDNLEQKRMRMQREAGFGEMSMSELAAAAPGERGRQLAEQLKRLSRSVTNIRFYNNKSMSVAESNLRRYAHRGVNEKENNARSVLEVKA